MGEEFSLSMRMMVTAPPRRDGQLWLIAVVLTVVLSFCLTLALGFVLLKKPVQIAAQVVPAEQFVTILPEVAEVATERASVGKRFARTSADQNSTIPGVAAFQGERNTQATSDRVADLSAPALPSQAGSKPLSEDDFETTESNFRDAEVIAKEPSPTPQKKLLDGPSPVEVPVRKPVEKPTIADPAMSGVQRKVAIQGSISRTGRSALDVEDSPLGRYQALISRAVELEWQRNCVRHRDFITPGFLTLRFFVEASGKVKTVQFVGEMETGEVQKGFTLNSIRDAKIPAMSGALKKEYAKDPLEIIFNFYF